MQTVLIVLSPPFKENKRNSKIIQNKMISPMNKYNEMKLDHSRIRLVSLSQRGKERLLDSFSFDTVQYHDVVRIDLR